ncbi:MAG TPA: phosphatase PAP2 family protein [Thermoanaerobaculia bacterium]|nr:phosphatase PAP2 family protein [Thermoanaerobaculia bacterium]
MKETPKKEPKRRHRFLPLAIGTTGSVVLAGVAFWFFKKQAESVVAGRADHYDELVMDVVHKIDNPPMHEAMNAITQLGAHFVIGGAAGITALAMWRQGRRQDAWTVVVSTGGAMVINTLLKNIFQRQRPIERARRITLPDSHSFPSGHSLLSAATYPIVAHHFVQNRSVATQAVVHTLTSLTILSVGFSRVYFGVHFPSDVLGGFAAGYGWLGLTSLAHTLMEGDDGL